MSTALEWPDPNRRTKRLGVRLLVGMFGVAVISFGGTFANARAT